MPKLFSLEDLNDCTNTDDTEIYTKKENELDNLNEEIDSYSDSFIISSESIKLLIGNLSLIQESKDALTSKEIASRDYFTSLESYSLITKHISNNLGSNLKIPSLEDFKNPYGTKASHEIAMEGFYEYVKKIWEKIKEVFIAFFKKVNMFFRRLLNYDLDLENYEKYLESMMVKIKNKKPTISDNSVAIDSKLPSLLANKGMENITSEFLINNGFTKVKKLKELLNIIFQDKIGKDTIKILKVFNGDLNTLMKTPAIDLVKNLETTKGNIKILVNGCENTLRNIFINDVKSVNSLPDDAYDTLQSNFTREDLEGLSISSLVDDTDIYNSLPKNFNAYTFIKAPSVVITSITQSDENVSNKIKPINNVENLIRFYEDYKKYRKDFSIKKFANSINELEDLLQESVTIMRNNSHRLLEDLDSLLKTSSGIDQQTKQEAIISDIVLDMIKSKRVAESGFQDELLVHITSLHITSGGSVGEEEVTNVVNSADHALTAYYMAKPFEESKRRVEAFQAMLNTIAFAKIHGVKDSVSLIFNSVKSKITDSEVNRLNGSDEITPELVRELKESINYLQKFITNYFTSMQNMISTMTTNLAGLNTELSYELAKYIYANAKLYKV